MKTGELCCGGEGGYGGKGDGGGDGGGWRGV